MAVDLLGKLLAFISKAGLGEQVVIFLRSGEEAASVDESFEDIRGDRFVFPLAFAKVAVHLLVIETDNVHFDLLLFLGIRSPPVA